MSHTRSQLFFAVLLLCGASGRAAQQTTPRQTPGEPPAAGAASQSITVKGCLGGGANAKPFTLSDVSTVPRGENGASGVTVGPTTIPASDTPATVGTAGTAGTSATVI